MHSSQVDHQFMLRAIALARRGLFSTDPNPRVGCVICRDDQIIAEGWHQRAGGDHAEIMALKATDQSLSDAVCYVTLEPCAHHGKTPPCADALIEAGIKRLVVAMLDPNPLVAGKGVERIRQAGIDVDVGVCESEARELNPGFIKRMLTGMPFVTLKMGMSMDAKTAMASGESQWITGPDARQQVQWLRARSSAVITGRQTVVDDQPAMNVRPENLPETFREMEIKQPVRLVLDSRARLTGEEQIFTLDENALWVSCQEPDAMPGPAHYLAKANRQGQIDLQALLVYLGESGMNEVLIEAGAELAGAFVSANLVDQLILYMAPKFLGDEARDLIKLEGVTTLEQAVQFQFVSARPIGSDVELVFKRGD